MLSNHEIFQEQVLSDYKGKIRSFDEEKSGFGTLGWKIFSEFLLSFQGLKMLQFLARDDSLANQKKTVHKRGLDFFLTADEAISGQMDSSTGMFQIFAKSVLMWSPSMVPNLINSYPSYPGSHIFTKVLI